MRRPWSRVLWLALFASLCAQAGTAVKPDAMDSPDAAATEAENETKIQQANEEPAPPEVRQKVRAFLDHFVDPNKTPAEQAALFTDPVEYYEHGTVGTLHIVKDVKRFQKQWPHRKYWVIDVPRVVVDPTSNQVFVDYTIGFEVANNARSLSGTAHYGAVLVDLDDSPKVEWIKENVSYRKAGMAVNR